MREKLLEKRQEVVASQKRSIKSISGTERRQDGFDVPFQEDGTDIHISCINSDKQKIFCIDRALELIEAEKYGICQACQQPIPLSRLEVMPFATHCTKCQSSLENEGPTKRRR